MKPDIKAQWLDALRSGEYNQGRSVLHDTETDTYCCLGVLCDLAVKAGVATKVDGNSRTYYGVGDNRDNMTWAYLPSNVVLWAGLLAAQGAEVTLHESIPGYGEYHSDLLAGTRTTLARINDAGGTFRQVADVIEEQL